MCVCVGGGCWWWYTICNQMEYRGGLEGGHHDPLAWFFLLTMVFINIFC